MKQDFHVSLYKHYYLICVFYFLSFNPARSIVSETVRLIRKNLPPGRRRNAQTTYQVVNPDAAAVVVVLDVLRLN